MLNAVTSFLAHSRYCRSCDPSILNRITIPTKTHVCRPQSYLANRAPPAFVKRRASACCALRTSGRVPRASYQTSTPTQRMPIVSVLSPITPLLALPLGHTEPLLPPDFLCRPPSLRALIWLYPSIAISTSLIHQKHIIDSHHVRPQPTAH